MEHLKLGFRLKEMEHLKLDFRRVDGVNMITHVLYSVNMYTLFLCKELWADIAL